MSKLLIVDDEVDVCEFAANFFRKRKIEVTTALNAEAALAAIEKDKPNLVLLDIKMPGMDGIETLTKIKERDAAIRVVMVTGRKPEEDGSMERCRQLGALDYIHKPLELEELERVVLSVLAERKER
jgi:two-component system response regulator (stage 0 sporulation protein F)